MQEVVQPLQQALVMGLQQPELAAAAVATLEAWEGLPAAAAQLHKVRISALLACCWKIRRQPGTDVTSMM